MRIQDQPAEDDQINLMPLIDMVFLLLIFFLVATQIAAEEIDQTVQLPTTGAPRALSAPPEQFIININEEGKIKVNGKAKNDDQLRTELKGLATDNQKRAKRGRPPINVMIRADKKSFHMYFAKVAGLCHETGLSAINIGYIYEKPIE
jgi:biopolymer transport protein ExbD